MKFIDLFAGIGGVRHGFELAGHTCVGWVEWDKFARKSYEAMYEGAKEQWNAKDIRAVRATEIPKADCWCFGFPCQDISLAGKQGGFTNGKRSSLFFKATGLIKELKEEDKPSYLFIENVKNLLSINKGWDFAKLLIEMDEIGYDCEWDVLDSAEVVPQHRERVYIVGHLRGQSTRTVFPIRSDDRKTTSVQGQQSNTITARYGSASGVGTYIAEGEQHQKVIKQINRPPHQQDRVYSTEGVSPAFNTGTGGNLQPKVAIPVLTPGRLNKRQNGRRFKTNGEPMFTLDTQDRHGVLNNDMRIRKLTPRECWRLQTFPDYLFERAEKVNSNSQLYKQAGNSVTCEVVHRIAEKMEVTHENE